ncbi:MAG: ankyrin repeat domain-containing protein [Victivallales bacterium]|nr:ankyrin repeat domain-containing protein [Victivallales bacterium]
MTSLKQIMLMVLFVLSGLQLTVGQPAVDKPKPLLEAVEKRDVAKIRELYKQDPQCLYEYFSRDSLEGAYDSLKFAIKNNDKENVLFELQGAIDINIPKSHDLPISQAIRSGNLEMVKLLVDHGAEINAPTEDATPPFVWAVQSGNLDIVKYLVENGAKLSFTVGKDLLLREAQNHLDVFKYLLTLDIGSGSMPPTGDTALHYVDNSEAIDILLAAGYDPNKKNNAGFTPLDIAIQALNYGKIRQLIAKGGDRKGRHFLNLAVFCGDLEMAQKLLEEGEDINWINPAHNCTILYDLFNQDYDIPQEMREKSARWLMAHGADVTRGSQYVWEGHAPSSLHSIAAHGSLDLLKEAMGKVDAGKIRELYAWDLVVGASSAGNMDNLPFVLKELEGSKIGRNILDEAMEVAAECNGLEAMKLLLKQGASPDGRASSWPPIYRAIEYGHPDLAKWLVENGADVNIQIGDRETPLMWAIKRDFRELAEYLLEHGADVHAKDLELSFTPMHYAAKTGNVAILKRLLAAGADKNAVDRIKQTPIDVAASEGNPPAFRLLLAQYGKDERKALLDKALLNAFRHSKRNMVMTVLEYEEPKEDVATIVNDDALRQAVLTSDNKKVKELVEKGADINVVDGEGNTLLDLAFNLRIGSGTQKQEIVNCLIDHNAKLGKTKPTLFVEERYWITFDEKMMNYMLKNGADVNELYQPNVRRTKVTFLAMNSNIPLLTRLLEAGADVNFREKDSDFTSLEDVIQWRWERYNWDTWIESVKCLLEHGADVNIGKPIVYAIGQKKYDAALLMLEHCKELTNKKDHEEAMFKAVADGRQDVVQKLAKFLPKSDKTTANAEAFLRRLALEGNVVGMQRLIEATGVDINCKDQNNDTPLFHAMQDGKLDAAMFLINHGADIKAVGSGEETMLYCAAAWDLGLVKYLVEHGLDVNAKSNLGVTPLHHAVCHKGLDIVAYLLEHGADIHVTAADGTPLAVCAGLGASVEAFKLLVEAGMDYKAKTKDGFTAMHTAVVGNPSLVPYLKTLGLEEPSAEELKKAKGKYRRGMFDSGFSCHHGWRHESVRIYID